MIDLNHSRRDKFFKCLYFLRDENENDLAKYVLEAKPKGVFYCKPFSPFSNQNLDIANSWRFDENLVSLETEDCVPDLQQNDLVLYDGSVYVVTDVQRKPRIRETQFLSKRSYTTYIGLRK